MQITDKRSFLMGVQVGRRLKAWDAKRTRPTRQSRTVEVIEIPAETISEEQEEAPNGR